VLRVDQVTRVFAGERPYASGENVWTEAKLLPVSRVER